MINANGVPAFYKFHGDAETTIQEIQLAVFDIKKQSIVGRGSHTDEPVIRHDNYNGDRVKDWARRVSTGSGFSQARSWAVSVQLAPPVNHAWRKPDRRTQRPMKRPIQMLERIKLGLGIAMLASLTGCVGWVDGGGGYGAVVMAPEPDFYFFGGYERGRDVRGYSHRGFESHGAAHPGGGGRGGGGGGGHSGGGGHGGKR